MRKFNFSAGPAALPEEVLLHLQYDLLDWQAQGVSILEMPHRAPAAINLLEETVQLFRGLLKIPDHFQILFMHGGARMQFAAIPMNLLGQNSNAVYLNTGYWSEAAAAEAKRYGDISVPPLKKGGGEVFRAGGIFNAAYVHYCDNETIDGIEFSSPPVVDNIPLVSDMSSNILSRPIDWGRFGLIYAGMQKNIGPAGLAVVVVREDLLDQAQAMTPSVLHYKTQVKAHSAYNTLPLFNIYAASLVFKWLQKQGGVEAIALINQRKAQKVYAVIDKHELYHNDVDLSCRSRMNITFSLPNKNLEEKFIKEARERGFINLEGHPSAGGIRLSVYNAISEPMVDRLVAFMEEFAKNTLS